MLLQNQLLVLFFALLIPNFGCAQNSTDFKQGVYNVGLGGVIGGVGAIINKKQDEKTGAVFLKGFLQGAVGGYLVFESKRMIREFGKTGNYAYVWPSKLVNAAGNSIIENAAYNNKYAENWHLNIGFNRFNFYPRREKHTITYRIMPFALIATASNFSHGKLNLTRSLKTGTFAFSADKIPTSQEFSPLGQAKFNSITVAYDNYPLSKEEIIAHELIHTYQYEGLSGFNAFLEPSTQKLNSKYPIVKTYHDYFYTDWNALISGMSYGTDILINGYNNSFYESEANFYMN